MAHLPPIKDSTPCVLLLVQHPHPTPSSSPTRVNISLNTDVRVLYRTSALVVQSLSYYVVGYLLTNPRLPYTDILHTLYSSLLLNPISRLLMVFITPFHVKNDELKTRIKIKKHTE